MRPIAQWDEARYDRSFAINLKGPVFLIQALLPFLANPASIVLNASINAHIGMPNTSVYAATKAGIASLARTLSGELIGRRPAPRQRAATGSGRASDPTPPCG